MKKRAGKKSSPLDDIRPERWTARMSDLLLELLWVLEATLAMEPELEKTLDKVVSGPCFTAAELPMPKPVERKAPVTDGAAGGLLVMLWVDFDVFCDVDVYVVIFLLFFPIHLCAIPPPSSYPYYLFSFSFSSFS